MIFSGPVPKVIPVPPILGGMETIGDLTESFAAYLNFHNYGSLEFGGGKWAVDVAMPGVGIYSQWMEISGVGIYEMPKICGVARLRCIATPNNVLPACILVTR